MNKIILTNEQWVEMCGNLTVILAEEYGDGGLDTEIADNGDEHYTDESQERFNLYNDEADSIMHRLGFSQEVAA